MKWFDIPENLIPKLKELQKEDSYYPLAQSENAVVMDGGLDDPMYLRFDGRIIIEDWVGENPPREAQTLSEAAAAIFIGAKKRNFPELLSLLPARPPAAKDCLKCEKSGWINLGGNLKFICNECGGLGWITPENK